MKPLASFCLAMLTSCRSDLRRCLWDLRSRTFEEKDMTEAIERTLEPHSVDAKISVRFNVPRGRRHVHRRRGQRRERGRRAGEKTLASRLHIRQGKKPGLPHEVSPFGILGEKRSDLFVQSRRVKPRGIDLDLVEPQAARDLGAPHQDTWSRCSLSPRLPGTDRLDDRRHQGHR